MSLIVQLGTTSVGYTSTLTSSVTSSSGNRNTSFRSQSVSSNQPSNVAKHRLPMQINRQSQHINRTIVTQPHSTLPVRNIAALARPLAQSLTQPVKQQPPVKAVVHNFNYQTQQQKQKQQQQQLQQQLQQKKQPPVQQTVPSVSPTVAGRVLASPVKDSSLDDDLLEGVVEKRPKYHKHLPLSYQYVLQDHNYGAPPPPTPPPIPTPKPLVNGITTQNGIARNQPHMVQQAPNYMQQHYNSNRTLTSVFGIGTRGPPPGDESDVDSSEGEREVDPQGEETETAPEGEGDDEDSVTRCVCEFQHDDGYMISCDKCLVWQHVDCMGIDRANIPEEYLCEKCQPRRIDKQRAIALQLRKRQELMDTSDTSSDTSSSSDSNVPSSIPVRKQGVSLPNRRRSEPAQRKNSSSSNNNNSVKPRRESAKEVQLPVQNSVRQNNRQTFRKKQAEKRPPVRRKSTPSLALIVPEKPINEKKVASPILSPDSSTSVQQLRQWIDSYEEAVTNHYSPELRARIASIKVNGIHSDLKLPTNLMSTPKCRVSLLPTGIKILVSSVSLPSNQPLLELRGKYMLCGSGPPNRPPRPAAPSPGPHIFHYQLPKDNTEVCVDARTYGNDARFVRRSCKPNAEVRHCVEKGTLHLYLVTTKTIEKNTEITLPHETHGVVPCACGENICSVLLSTSPSSVARDEHKTHNGAIAHLSNNTPTIATSANNNNNNNINNNNDQPMDKRRRGRRRTVSENSNPQKIPPKPSPKTTPKVSPTSKTTVPKPMPSKVSPVPQQTPPPPPPPPPPLPEPEPEERLPSPQKSPSPPPPAPITRSSSTVNARKVVTPVTKKEIPDPPTTNRTKREASDKKKKMTREERKMEAIMKAFERMEKDQARKQEVQARQAQRKDSTESDVKPVQSESIENKKSPVEKEEVSNVNKASPRKRKFSTSRRKGRGRSQNAYQSTLRPRRVLRHSNNARSQSPGSEKTSSDEEENTSPVIVHSTPPRVSRTPSPPSTPLSQGVTTAAGLLMEFSNQSKYSRMDKSPPYDGTLNSQLNTSGHSTSSSDTPPTPMSKTCMLVAAAVGPLAPGFKFPKTKKGMLNSWFKSPENSPPAPLCSPPTPADESPTRPGPGFAKKRWLRQAISEECDSPNSRPDMSASPTDYVAPLKKRRFARESISSQHSFTPPTTPTHNNETTTQLTYEDEDETVPSPPEIKEKQETQINDMEGSSQDSEDVECPLGGPRTPPVAQEPQVKSDNISIKNDEEEEVEDEAEEGEEYEEDDDVKKGETEKNMVEDEICEEKESATSESQSLAEQACAIKRKLSISEYRQRKQQGGRGGHEDGDNMGEGDGDHMRPSSPATSATSSMSSSSSDEEEEETPAVPAVIAKSLLLEAALDTNLAKQVSGAPLSRFSCAPTSVERQRENLTERLKREFGLFLSDDEEQEKIRRGTNPEPPGTKEKESFSKKKLPPPPPPLEPPSLHYPPLYYPSVGRPGAPIYQNHFPTSGQVQSLPPPPTLIEPQYYQTSSSMNTFYSQLPH